MFLKVEKDLLETGLSPIEILVIAQIMEFETNMGDCFISNDVLAKLFGVSTTTIDRCLKGLETKGLIKRDTKIKANGGKERHIRTTLSNKQNEVSSNKQNEVSSNKQNEVSSNKQNDIIKDNIKDNIEKIKEKDNSCAPGLAPDGANRSQSSPDVKEVGFEQAKQMWGNTFTIDEGGYIVFSADSINVNLNRKFKMRQ